jgi:predicted nuclease with TOPRIM domain
VALAAIQGLNQKVETSDTRIQSLEAENADLKKQNDLLARRLDDLEQAVKALAEKN